MNKFLRRRQYSFVLQNIRQFSAIPDNSSTIDVESISSQQVEKPKFNTFNAGCAQLPHPEKRKADGTGGEDAYLISDDQ